MNSLPIYRLLIAESLEGIEEVEYVSMVQNPAIQRDFMAFNDKCRLVFSSDERRIITGPAIFADTPIYRRDQKLGEYYVIFDQENVMKAAQKFFQKGYSARVNLGHDQENVPPGVFIFESWVTDEARGVKPPAGFEDSPNGSWFISAKVNDNKTWEDVKAGTYKGFSVEGFFGVDLNRINPEPQPESMENILDKIKKILES